MSRSQSRRWAGVDSALAKAVSGGAVPGAAALVADREGGFHESTAGVVRAGSGDPVTAGTLFRFASMTKPLVSVAALRLVEQGRLRLGQEVASVLPSFAELQVLEGFDGSDAGAPRLRPARRQATIRELLNHTSGLGYFFTNHELARFHEVTGLTTEDGALESLRAPLVTDPGTRWEYGVSSDYLGLVVEAVSGQDLDSYLREHVFGPLGMVDATFSPTEEQRARLMPVHYRDDGGALVEGEDVLAKEPEFWSGGGGAYGTVRDYGRFASALLRGGELDGARVLAPETVELMFTDLLGDIELPEAIISSDPELTNDVPFAPVRNDFALGLHVMLEDLPGMRRAGSGGWAGIFNTEFWIDRTAGVAAVLMTQVLPCNEARVMELFEDFELRVYEPIGA